MNDGLESELHYTLYYIKIPNAKSIKGIDEKMQLHWTGFGMVSFFFLIYYWWGAKDNQTLGGLYFFFFGVKNRPPFLAMHLLALKNSSPSGSFWLSPKHRLTLHKILRGTNSNMKNEIRNVGIRGAINDSKHMTP